ncbi:hypothetical protein HDU93_000047 [Gonapodya sp. JEL0774]|nr:hypothetical protein HDU93_000047 [Gonapodya sp. JEL0774]
MSGYFEQILSPAGHMYSVPKVRLSALQIEFCQAFGEFIGTWFFVYIGLAAVNASQSVSSSPPDGAWLSPASVLLIAGAFGFGLAINVSLWYRVSGLPFIAGGSLNPAVTLALLLSGKVSFRKATLYIIAEIAGGIVAAGCVSALYPGGVIGVNKVAAPMSRVQAVFAEAFGTYLLVSTVFLTAVEKSRVTFMWERR